jgi:hypothetical protein
MNLDDKLKDKDLENLMGDNFKKETPSSNFTHLVMQKVAREEINTEKTSMPLVSRLAWFIFSIFALLIGLALIFNKRMDTGLLISLPEFDFTNFEGWYGIIVSIIATVSVLTLTDMLLRNNRQNKHL